MNGPNELNELDSIYSADPRLQANPTAAAKQRMLTQRILAALAQQYKPQSSQPPAGAQQQQQPTMASLFNAGQGIGGLFNKLFW